MTGPVRLLAGESLVYGLAAVASRIMGVLLLPLYGAWFEPAEFGRFGLALAVQAIVVSVAGLGLDSAAMRWYWDDEDEARRRRVVATWWWCQMLVTLLAGGLLWLLADPVARHLLGDADIAPLLRILAIATPLGAALPIAIGWLRMRRRPWATTLLGLGSALIIGGVTLVLIAGHGAGATGACWGQVAGSAAGLLATIAVMGRWLAPGRCDGALLRTMLRFCLPLLPSILAAWLMVHAARLILQHQAGIDAVGILQYATSLSAVVAVACQGFQAAWGPFSLSIHQQPDAPATFARAMRWLAAAGGVLLAGFAAFAPEALLILGHADRWTGVPTVAILLAAGHLALSTLYLAAIGPNVLKTSTPTAIAYGIGALAAVIASLLLVPGWGVTGAAAATLIGQLAASLWLFAWAHRRFPVPWPYAHAALLGAGGLGLGLALSLQEAPGAPTTLGIKGLAVAVYAILAWLSARQRPGIS